VISQQSIKDEELSEDVGDKFGEDEADEHNEELWAEDETKPKLVC